MNNNKQMSIDFLLKELEEIGVLNIKNCDWSDEVDVKKAIEQAKAMHKEEIMDANFYGQRLHAKSVTNTMMKDNAEQYYNETFGE